MRTWKSRGVGEGLVQVVLYQRGFYVASLFVSSVEAANQIGRLWAENDPYGG